MHLFQREPVPHPGHPRHHKAHRPKSDDEALSRDDPDDYEQREHEYPDVVPDFVEQSRLPFDWHWQGVEYAGDYLFRRETAQPSA